MAAGGGGAALATARAAARLAALLLCTSPWTLLGADVTACPEEGVLAAERCPPGSVAACWSRDRSAPWTCWPADSQRSAEACASWPILGLDGAFRSTLDFDGPGSRSDGGGRDSGVLGNGTVGGGRFALYDGGCELPQAPPELEPDAPVSWDEAYGWARATLSLMTDAEKFRLLQGVGWDDNSLNRWSYVGNTLPIPRLGLPSLNMQDGPAGFRTYWAELVGTVTCWPSLLSLAASWDPKLVLRFGLALGTEFRGKGANGVLGPAVNVHRVARGGRNFEYMSGEDPYLGARLAEAYVRGVQSRGVITVVKHWVFNEQETNRATESSDVDEKTAWELYYPPFQAAVDAGASGFMCSYNRVDGEPACSNKDQLERVLKGAMGFRGFVQSDWWANPSSSSAEDGLDQEMPGRGANPRWTLDSTFGRESNAIDDSALRVLAAIGRLNLSNDPWLPCAPPHCEDSLLRNVASRRHAQLARVIAADSAVMLQNLFGVLPLSKESAGTIAVIGAAAAAPPFNPEGAEQATHGAKWAEGDLYSGGGSGHVVGGGVATPLESISRRASAAGVKVVSSASDSVPEAVAAAARANVAVVLAGATSGESSDRPNLSLEGGADGLIRAVAAAAERTVVLVQAPGAVLMPWRSSVASILVMFLGGQETGPAWAELLFGDRAPGGRLPVVIPETEEDAIAPSDEPRVAYSEGMATSYRNRSLRAAFPFGHGLTYSKFAYLLASYGDCSASDGGLHAGRGPGAAAATAVCVRVPVVNVGKAAARTVAQLYLELPPAAGHPAPLLKGFWKTGVLRPGGQENVTFRLTSQDLSYYDTRVRAWVKSSSAVAHIGESSADIRQTLPILVRVGAVDFLVGVAATPGSGLPAGFQGGCLVVFLALCALAAAWKLGLCAGRLGALGALASGALAAVRWKLGTPSDRGAANARLLQTENNERRAVAAIRDVIRKVRVATPQTLHPLRADLKEALQRHLGDCGARRNAVEQEAQSALAQALVRCGAARSHLAPV